MNGNGDGIVPKPSSIPLEGTIARAYDIVDAALWELLFRLATAWKSGGMNLRPERLRMSSGSTRYVLVLRQDKRGTPLGSINLRAITGQLTYYEATPPKNTGPEIQRELETLLHSTLDHLIRYIATSERQSQQMIRIEPLDYADVSPDEIRASWHVLDGGRLGKRKLGMRITWEEDDWAWEQVNTEHRPRAEVRSEWEQQLSPTRRGRDGKGLKDLGRSFDHAVDPNRQPKGKGER